MRLFDHFKITILIVKIVQMSNHWVDTINAIVNEAKQQKKKTISWYSFEVPIEGRIEVIAFFLHSENTATDND